MSGAQTLFRVYAAPGAFFFIKVASMANPTTYYAVGGLIGMYLAQQANAKRKPKDEAYCAQLDQLSIKERVDSDAANFRIPYPRIAESKITLISGLFGPPKIAKAFWKLNYEDDNGKTLKRALIINGNNQLLAAVETIGKRLPGLHQDQVGWSEERQRFVKTKKR